jgi:flagellar basal-body rod modification protein FlgD
MATVDALTALSGSKSSSSTSAVATSNQEGADRFLKLLVTQLQNQDPMNPMDNAQLTSQMAQINTVAGIEKLNTSVNAIADKLGGLDNSAGLAQLNTSLAGLSGQMLQSQTLQGAALVGRPVLLQGSGLLVENGAAQGVFDLGGSASAVRVDVLSANGQVLDSQDLGALAAGRGGFTWTVPEGVSAQGLKYRITATNGSSNVGATTYSLDRVGTVSTGSQGLVLNLNQSGATAWTQIKAVS